MSLKLDSFSPAGGLSSTKFKGNFGTGGIQLLDVVK